MAKITYTRLPSTDWKAPVKVVCTQTGRVTTFGDSFAYSCWLQGMATAHQRGVTVSVIDEDGIVVIGTVELLDPVA